MDHCTFNLPPEGSAKKENKLDCFEHNHIFFLNCIVLALFTFYALPSGGKSKDAVVHSIRIS